MIVVVLLAATTAAPETRMVLTTQKPFTQSIPPPTEGWSSTCRLGILQRAVQTNPTIQAPKIIHYEPPRFPEATVREFPNQATVIFEEIIDESGRVSCIRVLRGPVNELTEVVKAAMRKNEHQPARNQSGLPMVTFQLSTFHYFPVR